MLRLKIFGSLLLLVLGAANAVLFLFFWYYCAGPAACQSTWRPDMMIATLFPAVFGSVFGIFLLADAYEGMRR